ncbi:NXPE family member 3-like [Patiria miniata]|uniref:NXPE C-terminal domain-containing protein n=1 Tax=Patiria miniata TaxID=46514 RepID=A0A914ATS6_PATMI|nr:NXPE family member 3-like [Patiria miniata]XP_038066726.1 NXPE family member 3-like [Patiria miniata]
MGGDLLWPVIRTDGFHASAPYDELIDHGNGSYSARLTLSWAGVVEPRVPFIHSAEYVAALQGVIQRQPVRFGYVSKFIANGTSEYTPCHMVKEMPFIATKPEASFSYLSPTEVCDYSDVKAGTNWYCLKPKTLPCSAISLHRGDWKASDEFFNQSMTEEEKIAWKAGIKDFAYLSNAGPVSVSVVQAPENAASSCLMLPECKPGLPPKPPSLAAGFYYKDSWKSNVCRERSFELPEILECLRNKRLYFYGDSTLRQWMLFLARSLGKTMKLQRARRKSAKIIGPLYAIDKVHNITLTFRHHDFPIRNNWLNFHDVKFTVNELDALPGGPNTVVLFTFWAHFTTNSVDYFANRMGHIQAAVKRLQQRGRSPTPVFFKSANTRADGSKGLALADSFILILDEIMRTIFSDMPNVTIIDAWGMTLSHRTGYRLHPVDLVLREEIKMFLNFLCQQPSQPAKQTASHSTSKQSNQPANQPTKQPTRNPASKQTTQLANKEPNSQTISQPFSQQTSHPTSQQAIQPARQSSTSQQAGHPANQSINQPAKQPASQPSIHLTNQPARQPSSQAPSKSTSQSASKTTSHSANQPTSQPANKPTFQRVSRSTSQPPKSQSGLPASQPVQRGGLSANKPSSRPPIQPEPRRASLATSQPNS